MARLQALLLGCVLAAVVFGAGWRILHPPVPVQDIEIHVTDGRGQPVENYEWEYHDWTRGAVFMPYISQLSHPGGIAFGRVPQHRVEFWVRAKGLALWIFGPVEPNNIPARLDVVLADLKVVSGVVTLAGKSVAGATVWLCLEPDDLIEGVSSGLLSSSEDLQAVTDECGSFRLGSEYEGRDLWVRASKVGAASGTAGPVRVGGPPIEVQLTDGGTIEGALRLPEHRDVAGAQVELYRIDPSDWEVDTYGHFTVTCGPRGYFRFKHVEEGPWLVRLLVPKPIEHDRLPLSPEHVPFVVEVTAGASSHLDMDLTQEPLRLEGRPKINGKPWTKAYFVLHLTGSLGLALDGVESGKDGTWNLQVRAPGKYQIVAWGNHQHDTSVPRRVYDVTEVSPTGGRWDKDIAWDPRGNPEFRLDCTSR